MRARRLSKRNFQLTHSGQNKKETAHQTKRNNKDGFELKKTLKKKKTAKKLANGGKGF